MKNFFYFSSLVYSIAVVLTAIVSVVWPAPDAPSLSPLESFAYIVIFILAVVGFTGFCIGLWNKYRE